MKELDRCAAHIEDDLGIDEQTDYHAALYACEVHGGAPIPDRSIPYGQTEGEDIRVNPDLPDPLTGRIILHELIHRLSNGQRYEELNPVADTDRRSFLERLAQRVSSRRNKSR